MLKKVFTQSETYVRAKFKKPIKIHGLLSEWSLRNRVIEHSFVRTQTVRTQAQKLSGKNINAACECYAHTKVLPERGLGAARKVRESGQPAKGWKY